MELSLQTQLCFKETCIRWDILLRATYSWVKPPMADLSSWTYSNFSKWRFSFIHILFAWYHRQRLLVQQRLTAFDYFHIVPTYSVLLERTDLVKKLFFHLACATQEQWDNAGTWMFRCLPFNSPTSPWCYLKMVCFILYKDLCWEEQETLSLRDSRSHTQPAPTDPRSSAQDKIDSQGESSTLYEV